MHGAVQCWTMYCRCCFSFSYSRQNSLILRSISIGSTHSNIYVCIKSHIYCPSIITKRWNNGLYNKCFTIRLKVFSMHVFFSTVQQTKDMSKQKDIYIHKKWRNKTNNKPNSIEKCHKWWTFLPFLCLHTKINGLWGQNENMRRNEVRATHILVKLDISQAKTGMSLLTTILC